VRLYVNGRPQTVAVDSVAHATARHRRATLELRLDSDAFLVAEVRGDKELFPILQRRTDSDGSRVLPYALTNPVFIDVDGNGEFDSPLPHEMEMRRRAAATPR
jgi:hypothetical protein